MTSREYEAQSPVRDKEQNRLAIRNAFETILARVPATQPEKIIAPFDLSDGHALAVYSTSTSLARPDSLLSIDTDIRSEAYAFIAGANYEFIDANDSPDTLIAQINVQVRSGFEGKGLGSGLLLVSDSVVRHAYRTHPSLQGRKIEAEITDVAMGALGVEGDPSRVDRYGWSSTLARYMGYSRVTPFGKVLGSKWRKKFVEQNS